MVSANNHTKRQEYSCRNICLALAGEAVGGGGAGICCGLVDVDGGVRRAKSTVLVGDMLLSCASKLDGCCLALVTCDN